MKKILVVFFCALFFVSPISCNAQNIEQKEKITEMIGSLYKDVKYYDEQVSYHAVIHIGACAFEFLVNDMVVMSDNGKRGSASTNVSQPINPYILHSGTQTWEVRLYPPKVGDVQYTELSEGIAVDIRLKTLRFGLGGVEELAPTIDLITTPEIEKNGKKIFADAGKPYVSYKGTFKAKVPYKLEGWSKSKDLTKMDKDKLERMLVAAYKSIAGVLERYQYDEYVRIALKREREMAQSLFYTEGTNNVILKEFLDLLSLNDTKVEMADNYKMVFYGNGHAVCLRPCDALFESILSFSYFAEEFGTDVIIDVNPYFIIPEGSDQLEVVR